MTIRFSCYNTIGPLGRLILVPDNTFPSFSLLFFFPGLFSGSQEVYMA